MTIVVPTISRTPDAIADELIAAGHQSTLAAQLGRTLADPRWR